MWFMNNSQEEIRNDRIYIVTGGISCCPNDTESKLSCYDNWGTWPKDGVLGSSDTTTIGTDYKNWAIKYACL